jgi:ElaB/YqjD/DUF883 family membrane-anchored ribosome-binding protein
VASEGKGRMKDDLMRATAELERSQDQLVLSIGALKQEITRTFDWREWVRRRPGVALALAFGVGLILGRKR